jgi:hypothetical protein
MQAAECVVLSQTLTVAQPGGGGGVFFRVQSAEDRMNTGDLRFPERASICPEKQRRFLWALVEEAAVSGISFGCYGFGPHRRSVD